MIVVLLNPSHPNLRTVPSDVGEAVEMLLGADVSVTEYGEAYEAWLEDEIIRLR